MTPRSTGEPRFLKQGPCLSVFFFFCINGLRKICAAGVESRPPNYVKRLSCCVLCHRLACLDCCVPNFRMGNTRIAIVSADALRPNVTS